MHLSMSIEPDQSTTCRFSLCTMWVQGKELRMSGLAISTFACCAIMLAQAFLIFNTVDLFC